MSTVAKNPHWPEGYAFLLTELDLAGTFVLIAHGARSLEKRTRNRRHARLAYDTVQRFRNYAGLTDAASEDLDQRLEDLRSSLLQLGEFFS